MKKSKELKLQSGTYTYTDFETKNGNKSYKTTRKRMSDDERRKIAVLDGGMADKFGQFYWITF